MTDIIEKPFEFNPTTFETIVKPHLHKAISETQDIDKQFKYDHRFSCMIRDVLIDVEGNLELVEQILESLFKLGQEFLEDRCPESSDQSLIDKFLRRFGHMLEMVIHKLLYTMYADCGPYYIEENLYQSQRKELNGALSSYRDFESDIDNVVQNAIYAFLYVVSRGSEQIDEVLLSMQNNRNLCPISEDHPEGNPVDFVNALFGIIKRLAVAYQPGSNVDRNPQISRITSCTRSRYKTVH